VTATSSPVVHACGTSSGHDRTCSKCWDAFVQTGGRMTPDERYAHVVALHDARRQDRCELVAADWESRREAWHATQFGAGEAT